MKMSVKMFTCAAVVSVVLLACNEPGINASGGDDGVGDIQSGEKGQQLDVKDSSGSEPSDRYTTCMICTDEIPGACYVDPKCYVEPEPIKDPPELKSRDVKCSDVECHLIDLYTNKPIEPVICTEEDKVVYSSKSCFASDMVCTESIPAKCYHIEDVKYLSSNDFSLLMKGPPPPYEPYKPSLAMVNKDVEEWMKEQLESGSGEKRVIIISDMHSPETQPPGLSAFGRSDRDGNYFVEYSYNGNKISEAEYYRILEEFRSQVNMDKRDLSIPGEIIGEGGYRGWKVLMTAKDIVELLSKEYYEIAISFEPQYQNDEPVFVPAR